MGDITEAIATIANENKDFKRALNVLIKYEIYCLLQRLADTGEEAIVITSDVWDCADLATQKGRTFVRDTEHVLSLKSIFQKYCHGSGESVTEDDIVSMETTSKQAEMEPTEQRRRAYSSPCTSSRPSNKEMNNDGASSPVSRDTHLDSPNWRHEDLPQSHASSSTSALVKVSETANTGSSEGSPAATSRSGDGSSSTDDAPVDFSWRCCEPSKTPHGQIDSVSELDRICSKPRVSGICLDEYTLEMKQFDQLQSRRLTQQHEDGGGPAADKVLQDDLAASGQDSAHTANVPSLKRDSFLSYLPLNSRIDLRGSLSPACFSSLLNDGHSPASAELMSSDTDILGCHIARRFKELDDQLLHGGCPIMKVRERDFGSREVKMFQNNRGNIVDDIPACKQDCDFQKHEETSPLNVSPVALKNRILKRLRSTEYSTSTDANCTRSLSICESADLEFSKAGVGGPDGDIVRVASKEMSAASSSDSRASNIEPVNFAQMLSPENSKHSPTPSLLEHQSRDSDNHIDMVERLSMDIKLEPDASDDLSGSEDMGDNSPRSLKYPGSRMRSHSGSLIHLNFTCKICGQNFKNRQYRDFHVKLHKSPHKFLCNLCNTGFDREDDCLKHQSSHTDPIYQCENCGYKCSREFRMRAHKEICGEPKKIHKCPYCEKQFAAQRYMRIHMKSHDMGNVHTCPYCQNTYPLKNSLLKHMKKKHMS